MKTYLIWASILLFLISLALPVVTFKGTRDGNDEDTWQGWGALFLGCLGPSVNQYAWFANLFWVAGTLFLVRPGKVPVVLLGIAVLLALNMFTLPGTVIFSNGGATKQQASALHYGAYVWLAALLAQLGAAITRYK